MNNQAVYSTSYAQKGTHTIVASYWGELGQAAGSKSGPLDEVIKVPHPTATVVMTSRSSTHVGQRITFTAIVTSTYGPIPDGERVTFYDGTTAMDSVWLVNGKAAYTTSSLAAKTHNIRAHYIGDADFTPSTGSVQQLVLKYSTEAGLTSAPNPSNYGQAVTFTATVTPSGPYPVSGNVRFWDGTTALGSVALNGGVATLTKRWLAVGTHSITAHYLGDSYNATTTSHIFYQVVQ